MQRVHMTKIKLPPFVLVAALLALSGCVATTPPAPGANQSAQVETWKADRKEMTNWLINRNLDRGMQIKSSTEFVLVFAKRIEGDMLASVAYGSRYDTVPELRVSYTFVETKPDTLRIVMRSEVVSNPGSGFERANPAPQNLTPGLQRELADMQLRFSK